MKLKLQALEKTGDGLGALGHPEEEKEKQPTKGTKKASKELDFFPYF